MSKKKMGRPLKIGSGTKLTQQAEVYFMDVEEKNKANAPLLLATIPLTVEGMCNHIKLDARTFYRYIERDDDLGHAAWMALQRITQDRVDGALMDLQNPTIAKFLLINNARYFYKERQEVEHTVDNETRTLLQQLEGTVNKI